MRLPVNVSCSSASVTIVVAILRLLSLGAFPPYKRNNTLQIMFLAKKVANPQKIFLACRAA
jgi:hypothetical protein